MRDFVAWLGLPGNVFCDTLRPNFSKFEFVRLPHSLSPLAASDISIPNLCARGIFTQSAKCILKAAVSHTLDVLRLLLWNSA